MDSRNIVFANNGRKKKPIRIYPKKVHWLKGQGLSKSSACIDMTGKE